MITFKVLGYLMKNGQNIGYRVELSEEVDNTPDNFVINVRIDTAMRLGMSIPSKEETPNGELTVQSFNGHDVTMEEANNRTTIKYIEEIAGETRIQQCLMCEEETGEFSINVPFSCIDDCSVCPFAEGAPYSEFCGDVRNMDFEGVCERIDHKDVSVDEVVRKEQGAQIAYEQWEERQYEKEMASKEKRAHTAEARRETKAANWGINHEITRQRKRIKAIIGEKCYAESMISLASVMSNISGSNIKRNENAESDVMKEIDKKLAEANKKLDELLKKRKEANTSRRKEKKNK